MTCARAFREFKGKTIIATRTTLHSPYPPSIKHVCRSPLNHWRAYGWTPWLRAALLILHAQAPARRCFASLAQAESSTSRQRLDTLPLAVDMELPPNMTFEDGDVRAADRIVDRVEEGARESGEGNRRGRTEGQRH